MRRGSIWAGCFVFTLLLGACGGESSGEEVVESGDGRASLSLAPGSLPEGVSLDDVQIGVLVDETAEPGAPVQAVQLLPDGLVLAEPATLTVALPEALDGGFLAIHMSGDSIEFLDGDIIQQDDEGFSFRTSVGHFSEMSLFQDLSFEVSVAANPEKVSVGQMQRAPVTITPKTEPASLWIRFDSDPPGLIRLIRFSAPQPPFSFEDARVQWTSLEGFWDPRVQGVEITKTPSGWETAASSTCLSPSERRLFFRTGVSFNSTLLSVGEPQSHNFVAFFEGLSAESVPRVEAPGNVAVLDSFPGDIFRSNLYLVAKAKYVCIEAGVAGSSTTTTTTEAADSGSGTTTSTQPPLPEDLEAAMPTNVVSVVNDDSVQIDIEFAGDAQALFEGGAHQFHVTTHMFGERLRVTGNVKSTDSEIKVDGRTVQDVPDEDGNLEVVTLGAEVTWEWTDNNQLRITITTEGVTVPDTQPEVIVLVQKTVDSEVFTLFK